jgi:hypothetical protein
MPLAAPQAPITRVAVLAVRRLRASMPMTATGTAAQPETLQRRG